MAQLVALMSGVVQGGVVEVVGLNLATDEIFTAYIGSVDSINLSVFIYSVNLHQFLILCSSKATMFMKLYFRTFYIYQISLVSLIGSIRLSFANKIDVMHSKGTNIRRVLHWSSPIAALLEHPLLVMSQWRSW